MLYSFSYNDEFSPLPELPGLKFSKCEDPLFMSIMGQIPLEDAQYRLLNDNRAYIAYLNDVPVGFGWVALGKAKIGELNHEFTVPRYHAYLWNFRVSSEFRGLGIYPRLLQYIIKKEGRKIDHFWIMHAPENIASGNGIIKAGFNLIADVSLHDAEKVIFKTGSDTLTRAITGWFGFTPLPESIASCWSCSSPYVKSRSSSCCCAVNNKDCSTVQ
jgi:GNAT superfamily N-acetyltransferase